MAITLTAIAKERKMGKVIRAIFTPYTNEDTIGDVAYELKNIVADSTAIDKEEPTINPVECETSDTPIHENITSGKRTVAITIGSLPDELLIASFGYIKDTLGNLYEPSSYVPAWGQFEFAFDSSVDTIIIPKVKITAKVTGSSLKTGIMQGVMSGTAYNIEKSITVTGSETPLIKEVPFYFKKDGKSAMPTAV